MVVGFGATGFGVVGAGVVVGFGATGFGVVGAGVVAGRGATGFGAIGAGVGFGVLKFEGVLKLSCFPSDCLLPFGLVIMPWPPVLSKVAR